MNGSCICFFDEPGNSGVSGRSGVSSGSGLGHRKDGGKPMMENIFVVILSGILLFSLCFGSLFAFCVLCGVVLVSIVLSCVVRVLR